MNVRISFLLICWLVIPIVNSSFFQNIYFKVSQSLKLNENRQNFILPGLFHEFDVSSKLIDIAYCISSLSKIKLPFNCPNECINFPNTTLIYQFTGDNILRELSVTGYIAIDDSEKLVYLSLRGTRSFNDALTDIKSDQIPYNHCSNCKIHKGFYETFQNTISKIDIYLIEILKNYANTHSFLIMGHSMGGSISVLLASHLINEFNFKKFKCITMGQPILGNEFLASYFEKIFKLNDISLNNRLMYRITNKGDYIPRLPISSNGMIYEQTSGEIFISNMDLTTLQNKDVLVCNGRDDLTCSKALYGNYIDSHLIYFKRLGNCGYTLY
ncbi:hypothetical protein PACTADRAFT_51650 [Pachysolen tannophilus NRRL Y-2460]|uniref:triacylglycerol lipase n=1 Tax=Pachysolen tannophilus NRRL Y-2460 TaxID=669874 RepID=A0A1E4TQ69_PACTA|nr:hypothetical protein PACTADRAFT_51650 [Pachysolen tannophilus NRRL Y-2460]